MSPLTQLCILIALAMLATAGTLLFLTSWRRA